MFTPKLGGGERGGWACAERREEEGSGSSGHACHVVPDCQEDSALPIKTVPLH